MVAVRNDRACHNHPQKDRSLRVSERICKCSEMSSPYNHHLFPGVLDSEFMLMNNNVFIYRAKPVVQYLEIPGIWCIHWPVIHLNICRRNTLGLRVVAFFFLLAIPETSATFGGVLGKNINYCHRNSLKTFRTVFLLCCCEGRSHSLLNSFMRSVVALQSNVITLLILFKFFPKCSFRFFPSVQTKTCSKLLIFQSFYF